jgi:predicted enzyme related to lactoylglutathione lyase
VFEAGRMVVCQDPNGSFFTMWQPKESIGCEIVNEPGSFCWNELATTDLAAARAFYHQVFGWERLDQGASHPADAYTLGGDVICGAHTAGEGEFPAWSVWFAVEDCETSAAKVTELGGSVFVPPNDMGFGIGAVVSDPGGAVFGIAKLRG